MAESSATTPVQKTLEILNYLGEAGSSSIAEICDALDLSRSGVYRIMEQLRLAKYVVGESGRWRLGPAVAKLALASVEHADLVRIAPEFLRILAEQTRESAGLAIPNGDAMVFVHREQSPERTAVSGRLGASRPFHCTAVGKAYLAFLSVDERDALVAKMKLPRRTPRTITTTAELRRELRLARETGWSREVGEFSHDSMCCGAAILDDTGAVIAAISVSGPAQRLAHSIGQVGPFTASTAAAISRRLGAS